MYINENLEYTPAHTFLPFVNFLEHIVPDVYNLIYIKFFLLGISNLLPWNLFINADQYFTNRLDTNDTSELIISSQFTFISGITAQSSNLFMLIVALFVKSNCDSLQNRIFSSLTIMGLCTLCNTVITVIDMDPMVFFGITISLVIVMNLTSGLLQSSLFGIATFFPVKYITAIIIGNNMSGILVSVMSILSKCLKVSNTVSAGLYFLIASLFILSTLFLVTFTRSKNRFWKRSISLKTLVQEDGNTVDTKSPSVLEIFQTFVWNKKLLISLWFHFFTILLIFPVVQLNITQVEDLIDEEYYQDVVTFLTFNICVFMGSFLLNFSSIRVRIRSENMTVFFVFLKGILRLIFFSMCNIQGKQTLPVLFGDIDYWIISAIDAFLCGFFTNCLMMHINSAKHGNPKIVSMLAALFLALGVTTGVHLSFPFLSIIKL